jgi:hypothetical protein
MAGGIRLLQVEWPDVMIVAVGIPQVWSIILKLCVTILQKKGIE